MRYFRKIEIANTRTALFILLSALAVWTPAVHAGDEPSPIEVDPQPLAAALNSLSAQSGLQFAYVTTVANGVESPGTSGTSSPADALDSMLAGTGLTYSYINDTTVAIAAAKAPDEDTEPGKPRPASSPVLMAQNQTSAVPTRTSKASLTSNNSDVEKKVVLDEIIVTGTTIRGVIPDSSPLSVYTALDIANTGATTFEQFISTLPQNLNTLTASAAGGLGGRGEFNSTSVNGIDLRGLGVGTTLVLMNGRRLALSSQGRTPDISLLPLGAIDRVEVLTDGASAIYGADAVGGVVNVILRDDLDSAETVLGYGNVTSGSRRELRAEQSFGSSWNSGNALVSVGYFDRSELDASERDFAAAAAPFTLSPEDTRKNVLLTVSQDMSPEWSLFSDLLYSARDTSTANKRTFGGGDFLESRDTEQDQYFANTGTRWDLTKSIAAEVVGSYSIVQTVQRGISNFASGPRLFSFDRDSSTFDITAKLDGSLFESPGGTVRFSFGAGYSQDKLNSDSDQGDGQIISVKLDRTSRYAFGELLVPIIGEHQNIGGFKRLELSLAARYTDYSDFGGKASPKLGLLWSPVSSLKLRGTYGESYRAPFLSQLDTTNASNFLFPPSSLGFADIWSMDNSSVMLFSEGNGNPDVGPENAQSYTVGFDFEFKSISGLSLSGTYFNIEYSDRLDFGDPTLGIAGLSMPADFPDLFTVNPSEEFVATILNNSENFLNLTGLDIADPAAVANGVTVVFDNRIRNLSLSELDGIDFALDYGFDTRAGNYVIGTQLTYMFDYVQKITANAPVVTRVDTLLNPANLKTRSYMGYSNNGFNLHLNINYVDDYKNPFNVDNPTIDSWTTLDLAASYDLDRNPKGFLSGVTLSLNVLNLLDADPPFVPLTSTTNQGLNEPLGYDPVNANPLGRFISIQARKRW